MNQHGRVPSGTTQGDSSASEIPTLSVVIPAFNEADGLAHLYGHLEAALAETAVSWEVLFIDDGSKDGTWSEICRLGQADGRVRGLRLSRNFGHQTALLAGLAHARGDAVISMDADMQHPPQLIPKLVDAWQKGAKIVKTVRIDPEDISWFKRVTSSAYYRFFSFLSGVEIKEGMADFRLMDRQVLDNLLQFKEEGLFLRGMIQWMGFPSVEIPFECGPRFAGTTKYSLRKMLRLAWHGVSSFSLVPLRVAIMAGLVSAGLSFLGVVYAIAARLLDGHVVPGWASSLALTSFFFCMLFIFLAIMAEYMGRILAEVRERPRFLVSEYVGGLPSIPAAESARPGSRQRAD